MQVIDRIRAMDALCVRGNQDDKALAQYISWKNGEPLVRLIALPQHLSFCTHQPLSCLCKTLCTSWALTIAVQHTTFKSAHNQHCQLASRQLCNGFPKLAYENTRRGCLHYKLATCLSCMEEIVLLIRATTTAICTASICTTRYCMQCCAL